MAQPNSKEVDTESVEEPEDKPEKPVVSEDDEGVVTVSDGKKPTRKERRADRRDDEVSRHREEAAQLRAEMAQRDAFHAQRIAQLEARMPQTQEDPAKRKMQSIRSEQESIQMRIRSATTPAEVETLRSRFYELNDESEELSRSKLKEELRREMQQAVQQPAGATEEAILRSEYQDVLAHRDPRTGDLSAMRWAKGLYDQMLAKGEPPTLATQRAALNKAAEEFGLRRAQAPAPTLAQQQRYGAVPAQAGATNSGDLRLLPHDMKLAKARWPELDEHDAYRKMASLLRSGQRVPAEE